MSSTFKANTGTGVSVEINDNDFDEILDEIGNDSLCLHYPDVNTNKQYSTPSHYYPSLSTGIYGVYCINNTITNTKSSTTQINNTHNNPSLTDISIDNDPSSIPSKQRIKIVFNDEDENIDVILSDEEEEEYDQITNDQLQTEILSLKQQLKSEQSKNLQSQIKYEKDSITFYKQSVEANQTIKHLKHTVENKDKEILSIYVEINQEKKK
eukprot:134635_1